MDYSNELFFRVIPAVPVEIAKSIADCVLRNYSYFRLLPQAIFDSLKSFVISNDFTLMYDSSVQLDNITEVLFNLHRTKVTSYYISIRKLESHGHTLMIHYNNTTYVAFWSLSEKILAFSNHGFYLNKSSPKLLIE